MSDVRDLKEIQEDIRTLTRVPSVFINAKLDSLADEVGRKFSLCEGNYSKGYKQGRADALKEIFDKAEEIQKKQIENLQSSPRRKGKMWAMYMNTYLGHIRVACKRLMKEVE